MVTMVYFFRARGKYGWLARLRYIVFAGFHVIEKSTGCTNAGMRTLLSVIAWERTYDQFICTLDQRSQYRRA